MTAVDERAAWLAWRAGGIGASDIGIILGLSSYGSPWSLWAEKSGLIEREDTSDNQRLRIGHRMEAVLAAEFHDMTGLYVAGEQTWCTHHEHKWARCTVDGFVIEGPDGTEPIGVVEFKTDAHFGWEEIPPAYVAQVRWQMFVTGLTRAWLVVMFAGFRVEVFEIAHDPADEAFMLERAAEFWQWVGTGTPPPLDGHDATADAIAAMWPAQVPDTVLVADDTLTHLLDSRAALKARISEDQKVVDQLDNEIAAAIGDNETVEVDGRPAWSYRAQSRTSLDTKALKSAHPELDLEPFTKQSTYRVLRPIKEKK